MKVDHIVIPISPYITPEQSRALTQRVAQLFPWVNTGSVGEHIRRCIELPTSHNAMRIGTHCETSYIDMGSGVIGYYECFKNAVVLQLEDFLSYNDN